MVSDKSIIFCEGYTYWNGQHSINYLEKTLSLSLLHVHIFFCTDFNVVFMSAFWGGIWYYFLLLRSDIMKAYKNVLVYIQIVATILLMKLLSWMTCTNHLGSTILGHLLLRCHFFSFVATDVCCSFFCLVQNFYVWPASCYISKTVLLLPLFELFFRSTILYPNSQESQALCKTYVV